MGRTLLISVELLAASIWIGSMVCLVVVSRIAKQVLEPSARVQLFRGIGRAYGIGGTVSLLIAIVLGLVLAGKPSNWTGATDVAVALAVVLVALTATGMAQARRMTAARRRSIASPDDAEATEAVRRGARTASVLRSLMGAATLAIVVLVGHGLAQ
ncbi:MAG: hypothetical protein ABI251_11430 [Mycobacteriaceae bacterium]